MSIKVQVLGSASATPRTDANPSSQVINIKERLMLVDCGEGTQVALRRYRVRFSRIKHIFITHLHGDHYFGLIGLISSFHLLDRKTPMDVYGPRGLKEILELQLRVANTQLKFELRIHELSTKEKTLIMEDDKVEVWNIPLKHRIYTNGYLFVEKPGKRKINKEACDEHGLDIVDYHNLMRGKDYVDEDGHVIPNEELTYDPPQPLSYAYCSDTRYFEALADMIQGVSGLYHESTFLDKERQLAKKTNHSTALQAGKTALRAGAGTLVIGHYSTRYKDLSLFKKEAEQIFPKVILAEDGKLIEISQP